MYHEAYVAPHPDGLWSRLHAEVAVLKDDVLVGHRLAVIEAPSVVESVMEVMVLWSHYKVQRNVIVNIVAEDLVGHCLASGSAAGSLKAETLITKNSRYFCLKFDL